ncbi:hypothetical protein ACHAXT_004682 [Thalassiosira profunda]
MADDAPDQPPGGAEAGRGGRVSTRSRSPVPSATRSSRRSRPTVDSTDSTAKEEAEAAATEAAATAVAASAQKRGRGRGKGKRAPEENDEQNNQEEPGAELQLDGAVEEEEEEQDPRKPLVLLGAQPRGLYECDYCGADLTRAPRARCAVCPDFDLCLECLATEDHHNMAKYKREEERIRRREAEKALAGEEEPPPKKGRKSKSRGRGAGEDDPEALGSYVGGIWVPYFRHDPAHGYVIADSARYTLFPSFRGVRERDTTPIEIDLDTDGEGKKEGVVAEAVVSAEGVAKDGETKAEEGKGTEEGETAAPKNEGEMPVASAEGEMEGPAKPSAEYGTGGDLGGEGTKDADVPLPAAEDVVEEKEPATEEKEPADSKEDAMDVDSEPAGGEEIGTGMDTVETDIVASAEKSDEVMEAEPMEEEKEAPNAEVKEESNADEEEEKDGGESQAPKSLGQYRVIDDAKTSWTAEEDLRLLDGILTCGLGNWPDIAEHINGGTNGEGDSGNGNNGGPSNTIGNKTDKQCMERYLDDFMGRYGHVLPPFTMVPVEGGASEEEKEEEKKPEAAPESSEGENGVAARKRPRRSAASSLAIEADDARAPGFRKTKFEAVPTAELPEAEAAWPRPYLPNTGVKQGEEVARDLWYRSEQAFVRQTVGASNKADAERIRKEFVERRAQGLAGYEANVLPPRLEDTKHLPGAELAGYMPRRGDFDMEWDNDAEKIIAEMEFNADDTKADRDLKLAVIEIFNKKLKEREKRRKFVIENKLLNYRENQEKMWKLPPDERHLVQRLRMFARFHTREEHEAFVNKVLEAKRLRKEIAKLQMYRRLGITSLADAERYELDKSRREYHKTAWIKREEERRKAADEAARAAREDSTVAGVAHPAASANEGPVAIAANESLKVWKQFKKSEKGSVPEQPDEKVAGEGEARFVIMDKPGYDLLSKKEAGLCQRLRLLPQNYLDVKKALIAESLKQGVWNPSSGAGGQKGGRSIFKVDITQTEGVVDFVLKAGWIPSRPNVSET